LLSMRKNIEDRFEITNQSRYCVSLATVFLGLTKYTAGPVVQSMAVRWQPSIRIPGGVTWRHGARLPGRAAVRPKKILARLLRAVKKGRSMAEGSPNQRYSMPPLCEIILLAARNVLGPLLGLFAGEQVGPKSSAGLVIPVEELRRSAIRKTHLKAPAVGDGLVLVQADCHALMIPPAEC
jgi:hypothetical protein